MFFFCEKLGLEGGYEKSLGALIGILAWQDSLLREDLIVHGDRDFSEFDKRMSFRIFLYLADDGPSIS